MPLTPAYAKEIARRTRLAAYLDRVDGATRLQPIAAEPAVLRSA